MSEPVKVLQLVNQFAIGGAEGQFVARLRGHPKGFTPLVACVKKEGPNLAAVEAMGLRVEQFPLNGTLAQVNTLSQVTKLAAFIEREGVKLLHANDFYTNLLAVPAAKMAGVKVICSRFDLGHWYSKAHHVLEAFASRMADAVYVNAGAVREMCVRDEGIPEERVVVVHNGLDLPAFDAAAAKGLTKPIDGLGTRPTVVAVGNLYPVKGHLNLIEAIIEVKKSVPDVLVLIAGEGPMRPLLEQQIRARGLVDNVLLLGHRLDVPAIVKRANVGCLPSHAEGLSNALMEAMAAGLPVVATSVGGNVEIVAEGETGHIVPPHKPAELAARLLSLLQQGDAARSMGAAARRRVEADLTLEAMSRRTGELYERVMAGAAAHPVAQAA